ncbi:MAG: multidrug effflux MFS transporter [Pseudomonadota bacterium]
MTSIPASSPARLHPTEFIALIAMMFATIAFSIDAMLPALPQIAAELSPNAVNRAQLIITSFVLGMGMGTLLAGPLSDSFGRKPVILGGAALYCVGTLIAYLAPTLETVLLARVIQGLGVAGPRIVSLALVRDLHKGREMARVVSFAMMVFTLVPAVAPLLGSVIIDAFGWRSIFLAFLIFFAVIMTWFSLRQPETLPPQLRRPMAVATLKHSFLEVLSHRAIRYSIAVQTLCFASLFGTLSATQPIFDVTFDRADSFPFWFAVIAVVAGSASLVNATFVVRLGMRRLVSATLAAQIVISGLMALTVWAGVWPEALYFPAYLFWTIGVFFMAGMTLGNLNALALEPVGHIAGMAASVTGAIATVASVLLAVPMGLAFDGTPVPMMLGVAIFSGLAFLLMRGLGPNPTAKP